MNNYEQRTERTLPVTEKNAAAATIERLMTDEEICSHDPIKSSHVCLTLRGQHTRAIPTSHSQCSQVQLILSVTFSLLVKYLESSADEWGCECLTGELFRCSTGHLKDETSIRTELPLWLPHRTPTGILPALHLNSRVKSG